MDEWIEMLAKPVAALVDVPCRVLARVENKAVVGHVFEARRGPSHIDVLETFFMACWRSRSSSALMASAN